MGGARGGGTRPFRKEVVPGLRPAGIAGCLLEQEAGAERSGARGEVLRDLGGCGVGGFGDSDGYAGDFSEG